MSALIKQAAVGKLDAWHNGHATLDILELQLKATEVKAEVSSIYGTQPASVYF